MNDISEENLNAFRCAVTEKAVEDYKKTLRQLAKHNLGIELLDEKNYKIASKEKRDIEKFFLNKEYFALFCDMDGERIMKTLQGRIAQEFEN